MPKIIITKKELMEYWTLRKQIFSNMSADLKPYAGFDKKRFLDLEKRKEQLENGTT